MNEIKPNWWIAQQISRRHTLISLAVALPCYFIVSILAIITFKVIGYANGGIALKQFMVSYRPYFMTGLIFIYFVPINLFAIVKVLSSNFSGFEIKIISKKPIATHISSDKPDQYR